MIFPITSVPEILIMDETDYTERWLLTSLDNDDDKPEESFQTATQENSYHSIAFSETTSSLMDEDEEINFDGEDSVKEECQSHEHSSPEKQAATAVLRRTSSDGDDISDAVGIPNKFDILCGQSRICANHTGNRRFQVVLDIYAPTYEATTSKQEKMALTKEIVACIGNSGGRFMKYKDGMWQEISTVMARDKVSHALRTKVSSWKRHQEQPKQEKDSSDASSKSTPTRKTHHKRESKRRRSSTSIMTTSFDAGDNSNKSSVMEDLLRAQREIFATLTKSEQEESASSSGGSEPHPLKK